MILLGLLSLLLALIGSAGAVAPPRHAAAAGGLPVPAELVLAAQEIAAGRSTAMQADRVARQAAELGHQALAHALAVRAAELHLQPVAPLADCLVFTSPLPGVTDFAWTEYVRKTRAAGLGHVSRGGRLGLYQLDARELEDVGLMTDVHKVRLEDGRSVWTGGFRPGASLRGFLESPDLQYRALAALTLRHAGAIAAALRDVVGQEFEGQPATLSGLLAVARKARLTGLRKWVEDASDRDAHSETTARYRLLNGIF